MLAIKHTGSECLGSLKLKVGTSGGATVVVAGACVVVVVVVDGVVVVVVGAVVVVVGTVVVVVGCVEINNVRRDIVALDPDTQLQFTRRARLNANRS